MDPAGQAGGTEGRQQDQLGPFGQLDMEGPRFAVTPLVAIEGYRGPAEAGQGRGTDQLGGTGGEHAAHLGAPLDQGAHHQGQLDRRNAAADSHQDAPARQGIAKGPIGAGGRGCHGNDLSHQGWGCQRQDRARSRPSAPCRSKGATPRSIAIAPLSKRRAWPL